MLPSPSDSGPPLGPSTAMGLLHLIPPLRKVLPTAFLAAPCAQDQAAQQAAPQGAPVLLLEQSFAQATGLKMGISMPPLVGSGLPSRGGSATRPAAQATQGIDANSVPGSAGKLRWRASPHFEPCWDTSNHPSNGFSSDSSSPAHSPGGSVSSHSRCNPRSHSKHMCTQR